MKLLVVGCERSGTTAIAKLISKGSGASFLNDPEDSWYIYPLVNIIGIRGFTLNLIIRLWKYKVVKIPGFVTILEQLRKVHPFKFKVVYIVREPKDNYAAIKERLNESLNGLYVNIHYLRITGKSIPENIAHRWMTFLECANTYKKSFPEDLIFIKYEDFYKDKLKVLRDISDFAKLDFKEENVIHLIDTQINKGWSTKI